MALIQFCCCWNSLRSGCYASALYTMVSRKADLDIDDDMVRMAT